MVRALGGSACSEFQSADSLMELVKEAIEPGSTAPTGGPATIPPRNWLPAWRHVSEGKKEYASELMPRVHRVTSPMKRCILRTRQGATISACPACPPTCSLPRHGRNRPAA